LVESLGGRYSAQLGIDVDRGDDQIERWALAATLFGARISAKIAERTFAVRERMQTLEEKLDPAVFFRVHRSVIVRLDRIDTLRRASGGDYAVRLKDGTELPVSRTRREELEQAMGIR